MNNVPDTNNTKTLVFYGICFALVPSWLITYGVEVKYNILLKHSTPDALLGLFVALFAMFFGIVFAVWRWTNKPKDK